MYQSFIKPACDHIASFFALLILSPLFLIVAAAIKIDSPGPAFFCQNRLGKNGRIFKIIKFRSMILGTFPHSSPELLESDPRITRVGKIIRKTSIDEIPQLFNILIGNMSFIGPRPPVTSYPKKYDEYSDFEKQRFKVKPGISGLAAIRCREIHDWSINIPIDVEYVNSISFILDIKLFLQSLTSFFRTDNIYRKE